MRAHGTGLDAGRSNLTSPCPRSLARSGSPRRRRLQLLGPGSPMEASSWRSTETLEVADVGPEAVGGPPVHELPVGVSTGAGAGAVECLVRAEIRGVTELRRKDVGADAATLHVARGVTHHGGCHIDTPKSGKGRTVVVPRTSGATCYTIWTPSWPKTPAPCCSPQSGAAASVFRAGYSSVTTWNGTRPKKSSNEAKWAPLRLCSSSATSRCQRVILRPSWPPPIGRVPRAPSTSA